ncbi:hypothetical protein B0T24DRAFT_113384 [Lasiosphaeria ovina]|uniref:Azaphilone pigments biosynthesis cluster protein L N-terminal domain-containing protein n=1 Tax=Lasiosphaeria ovina TaxID=92902 RepID=A0AAE0MZ39_9PEZI|nr:hypothetical protein B0T24DRAFT_113384 [Lasiosphaeria ovina]
MDGVSIAATCFSLAGGIAKASVVLVHFARDVRDAAQDLDDVLAELRALASVLNPLTKSLTQETLSSIPEQLVLQVESTLGGCTAVVEQIEENVHRYRRNNTFTRVGWVMFGQDDMRKLRNSLEAYKMALSLGIHAISLSTTQAVKEDTLAIRECAQAIKVNTDDILARVNSIRHSRLPHTHQRVEEWIDDMNVLSLYAETSYQGTVADLADIPSITGSLPRLPEEITPPVSPETNRLKLGKIEAFAVPGDTENVDPLSRQTSWTTQETSHPAVSKQASVSSPPGQAYTSSPQGQKSPSLPKPVSDRRSELSARERPLVLIERGGQSIQVLDESIGRKQLDRAALSKIYAQPHTSHRDWVPEKRLSLPNAVPKARLDSSVKGGQLPSNHRHFADVWDPDEHDGLQRDSQLSEAGREHLPGTQRVARRVVDFFRRRGKTREALGRGPPEQVEQHR